MILLHLQPQVVYPRRLRLALDPTIDADIVIAAIAVPLAIIPIMFPCIRDQVPQREAIMARHKINTMRRRTARVFIDIRTAHQTGG